MRKWVSSPEYRAAIEVIVRARQSQGLTQRDVESRLGKPHHGWLAKIEVGERQMNIIEWRLRLGYEAGSSSRIVLSL